MKIMIYFPVIGTKAGVAVYTEDVINNLTKYSDFEIVLLTNKIGKETLNIANCNNLQIHEIDVQRSIENILFQLFQLNKYIKCNRINTIMYTANPLIARKIKRVQYISTINDLNEFDLKNKYSALKMLYRKYIMIPCALKNSDKLIAISHFTYSQIKRYFPNHIYKTQIIYDSIRDSFKPIESIKKNKSILFVGRIDPIGKNLYKVLELFEKVIKYDQEYTLLLAGGMFDGSEKFINYAKNRFPQNINILGFVSDKELLELYNKSKYTILFSKFEGFGFPAFESMKCGTPVIINKECKVLNQLIADVGIAIDENTFEGLNKFIELEKNISLYNNIIEQGFSIALKYSPEKNARQLIKIIEEDLAR